MPRADGPRGRQPTSGLAPRQCETCGASFNPYRQTQRTCSRVCHQRRPDKLAWEAAYKAQPHVRDRKNSARRVENDPARREINMRQNLNRYGLTVEQYDAMRDQQNDCCAICGDPPDPNGVRASSRLHVDHDHVTGRNRDLLCTRCNRGVGYFHDDPALLRAAAEYIERHRSLEVV